MQLRWNDRAALLGLVLVPVFLVLFLGMLTYFVSAQQGNYLILIVMGLFVLSSIGLQRVAWITFDSTIRWRSVDYIWILISAVTVMVAILQISEQDRLYEIDKSSNEIEMRFLDWLHAADYLISVDCSHKPQVLAPAPEPYHAACTKLQFSLPGLKQDYDEFVRSSDSGALLNKLSLFRLGVLGPYERKDGWGLLFDRARILMATTEQEHPKLQRLRDARIDTRLLRYWYVFAAFFVALRLAKTTAEIRQELAKKPMDTPMDTGASQD